MSLGAGPLSQYVRHGLGVPASSYELGFRLDNYAVLVANDLKKPLMPS